MLFVLGLLIIFATRVRNVITSVTRERNVISFVTCVRNEVTFVTFASLKIPHILQVVRLSIPAVFTGIVMTTGSLTTGLLVCTALYRKT